MLQLDEYDELIAEELKPEAEAERRRRARPYPTRATLSGAGPTTRRINHAQV